MTCMTPGRFVLALIGAALAGAMWPSETVFITAHVALLAGGIKAAHVLDRLGHDHVARQ